MAHQPVSVLGGPLGQVVDESLDQVAAGFAQHSRSAVVSGVEFDLGGVELMLADELTEAIAEPGLAIARGPLSPPIGHLSAFGQRREGSKFLNRAEADAIGLAQSTVDRTGFGHAQLGAVD